MNTTPPNPNPNNGSANDHLDADLAMIAAGLDRLGASDRAAARVGLEDRLFQASLASLHGVVETGAQVSELGAIDRAAAPAELEETVYEASRAELVSTPSTGGLRLVGEGRIPGRRVVTRSVFFTARVRATAAALLVCGAGVVTYIGVQSNSKNSPIKPVETTDALAAKITTEMDTLFVAMEGLTAATTESTETEFNPEWLDELKPSAGSGSTGGAS